MADSRATFKEIKGHDIFIFIFFLRQVSWRESGELNKGESSSVNGTLLHCHSLWPFLFVQTSQGFSLSKWPTPFVSDPSLPVPFFFPHICHLQWLRDATASVSSVTTLTHTQRDQTRERRKRKKVGRQKRQWKRALTSSFNCVSECPSRLHYPGILRNLTCLLLETCEKAFVVLFYVSTAARKYFSWTSRDFSVAQIEAYFKQSVKPRIFFE